MNKNLPNLILALATATAALSAASARRPWREVAVQPGVDTQEVLAFDLELGGPLENTRGLRLSAALATELDSLSFHTVRVRNPAQPIEEIALEDAAGEVLAAPITLANELETLRPGRIVTPALIERAAASGKPLPTVKDGPVTRLSDSIELPKRLRISTYLDDAILNRLRAAGTQTVAVKRVAPFTWEDWSGRWAFTISIFAMLIAIALKRSGSATTTSIAASSASVATLLIALKDLTAGAQALAERADSLDAAAIHAELDPLLTGPAYEFVEGYETLRQNLGMSAYALVMDPFSRGERQLARAWSASVDEHAEESRASLLRAAPLLQNAVDAFPS